MTPPTGAKALRCRIIVLDGSPDDPSGLRPCEVPASLASVTASIPTAKVGAAAAWCHALRPTLLDLEETLRGETVLFEVSFSSIGGIVCLWRLSLQTCEPS